MPAAARLTWTGRWLALIAPPYVPYAPAFAAHGVTLSRLMLVRTTTTEDSLWACEQALRSQACGAALAWLDRVHERALRRLQLAAESGGATMLLFRPARAAPASHAALRLHIGKSQSRTLVRVLKRRGGGLPAPVTLDLHGTLPAHNERRGTGPFRQTIGAFPFPPHPPSHDEPSSRETSGGERAPIAQ
jgi:cell division inhibitor SulA/protein ImuA